MRLRRKVCVLGASGVGKTSLVRRFVEKKFDEDHQRTIGVAISKGTLTFDEVSLELMLWDYEGAEPGSQYSRSFISGASGLVFVVDVTRPETLDHLLEAQVRGRGFTGHRPSVLVANKIDMTGDFALTAQQLDEASKQEWFIVHASAKSGDNVDDAFAKLGQMMLDVRKKSA
ncbi:MAG: GTP-binding protein [Myxococcales bacterium]|nr:GTP-binding protein [Myxococcales bacterium]MDH3483114.1 GTP-binding protein [Myxococcales bacterium]